MAEPELRQCHLSNRYWIGSDGSVWYNRKTQIGCRLRKAKYKLNNRGYVQVTVEGKLYSMHRLVAFVWLPVPDFGDRDKLLVMHKDDNKRNNAYMNLQWGTVSDNAQDMISKGRGPNQIGECNHYSKLTDDNIREI